MDILGNTFDLSHTFAQILTVVLAFGFLATLVVAWYHGERGHQSAQRGEIAILLALVLACATVSWRVGLAAQQAGDPTTLAAADPATLSSFDPTTARASVAVLPFANLTADAQNDYFSEGITEDIIAQLSRIRGVKVISRTSVMQYRNTTKTIRQIGAELGVGAILEGSVRVSPDGKSVRIVAQLIDVATDDHIWSETYDRELKDIFAVQSDVAAKIADALGERMSPAVLAGLNDGKSHDPEAVDMYFKARAVARNGSDEDRRLALALFDSAVARDPDLAQAWADAAELRLGTVSDIEIGAPPNAAVAEQAARTAEKAMRMNPNLPQAHLTMARRTLLEGDVAGALAAARTVVDSFPNDVQARRQYGFLLSATGRPNEALRELSIAARLDPASATIEADRGEVLFAAGRIDDAKRHLERAISLDSTNLSARVTYGLVLQRSGDAEGAMREMRVAQSLAPSNPMVLGSLGYVIAAQGNDDGAQKMIEQIRTMPERRGSGANAIAQIYVALGRHGEAIEELGRVGRAAGAVLVMPRLAQALEPLRDDPRFRRLLDSLDVSIPRPPGPPVQVHVRDSTRRGRR
jgi:serine/threonine-protein kinase